MNGIRLAAVIAVMLSGCVDAPKRVDPFASISAGNPDYKRLTLAVVLSENTRKSIKYTGDMVAMNADPVGKAIDYRGSMGEHANKIFPEVAETGPTTSRS